MGRTALNGHGELIPPEVIDPAPRSAWMAAIRYFGVLQRGDGPAAPQAIDNDSASHHGHRLHVGE
jgi:hypothetical protein